MRRAQSSAEFFILIGGVLFFALALAAVFNQQISQKNFEKRDFEIQEVALTLQNELDIAAKAVDGYRREFQIADKIAGLDYSATLIAGSIYLNTSDGKHALALPAQNATGQFLVGQTNVITKQNGEILVN